MLTSFADPCIIYWCFVPLMCILWSGGMRICLGIFCTRLDRVLWYFLVELFVYNLCHCILYERGLTILALLLIGPVISVLQS